LATVRELRNGHWKVSIINSVCMCVCVYMYVGEKRERNIAFS